VVIQAVVKVKVAEEFKEIAVSFNAHDYAGHLWGPDSWETLDLTLRFDARLGELFEQLDRRLGRTGWAVVLASDHGATPVVERTAAAGVRRIRTGEIARVVEAAVAPVLGGDRRWVASVLASNIYFVPELAGVGPARSAALDAAAAALAKLPNVAAAGRVDRIADDCAARRALGRALCLASFPAESGELYVVPAAGSLITDYDTGTQHDAPFPDNTRVPIFVMAPGLAPRTGEGSLLQVAPTVAALLRIPPPPAATAAPLFGLAR
jgi:arylsulfatase A-like enzyme